MRLSILAFLALCLAGWSPARAAPSLITTQQRRVTPELRLPAEVKPLRPLALRAGAAGMLAAPDLFPGQEIRAGQVVGRIVGPEARALLAARLAAWRGADAEERAAKQALAIATRQRHRHLATRNELGAARVALAKAEGRLQAARATLAEARGELSIKAPKAGRIAALLAGDGERVAVGQAVLTLVPQGGLFLAAAAFGGDGAALRPGLRGRFEPLDGGRVVFVRLRGLTAPRQSGGGQELGLVAIARPAPWRDGETGTLVLPLPARRLPAVPSRALILDRGRWWVLVQGTRGLERRAVVPGPRDGGWTLIQRGLAVGEKVVADQAYLRFHRDFAVRYQPPD